MTASSNNNKRHYAENFCETITENGVTKQYIISIANEDQYIEIYDFENNLIYEAKSEEKFGETILSLRHSSSNILYNSVPFIIFLSWNRPTGKQGFHYFITKALKFNSKDIAQEGSMSIAIEHVYNLTEERSSMTSCFVSESNLIWVMGFYQESEGTIAYYIILYNPDNIAVDLTSYRFNTVPYYDRTFFKIVHLRGEIGVGFFFAYQEGTGTPYPFFVIKEYKSETNTLEDYIPDLERYLINFSSRMFNYDCFLNDLIRITEYKVAFSTMNMDKEKLFIAIFEVHPDLVFMKLYEIDFFPLYNIKFFHDVREHLFEQYLAFGFNYCNSATCEENTDTHFSAFLVFSYPNSTDGNLNINQYLEENEGKTIENININLTNNIRIENNIFGNVFSSIHISELIGCDNLVLKSGANNNIIIKGYNLTENELIKMSITNDKQSFNCSIYFRYIITEPSYSENKKYYVDILPGADTDYETIYNTHKTEYLGKISLYNITYEYIEPIIPTTIKLKEPTTILTEKVTEYIAYTTQNIKVITTEKITEKPTEKPTLKVTERPTQIITERPTEKITERPTEKITEKPIEQITKRPTEKLTEKPIEQITERLTEKLTEKSIEQITERPTEKPTLKPIELITQRQTEKLTEKPTIKIKEQITEQITYKKADETTKDIISESTIEKITEQLNEIPTEKLTEKANESTQNKEKISTRIIPEKTEEIKSQILIKENNTCSNYDLLDNKCGNITIETEQVKELFSYFSTNIQSYDYDNAEMKIIKTENVIFQITTLDSQEKGPNQNVSYVEIGECEKKLKSIYNISESKSLIMIKSDSKGKEDSPTNVLFELYNPDTKEKLNMSYCDDVEIKVHVPTELENNTIDLYDSILESGYNLFDYKDPFYNDHCSIYTSPNGTDMILTDRQNIIYSQSGNISLCQSGCEFNSYNKTQKTAQCDCDIKSVSVESSSENKKEDFKESFVSTLLNSNFMILKCLKLVFSSEHFFNNKGRLIMTLVGVFFVGMIVIFLVIDRKNINKYLSEILKDKMLFISKNALKKKNNDITNIKEKDMSNNKENIFSKKNNKNNFENKDKFQLNEKEDNSKKKENKNIILN